MKKEKEAGQVKKAGAVLSQKKAPSPAERSAAVRKTLKKRRKQYRHLVALLRAAIRIVNAFDHKTIYRK